MKLEEAINNLENYIKLDSQYIEYDDSDFAKFCKNHCEDIAKIIHYIKEESISKAVVEEKIEELDKEEKDLQDSISEEEREEYSDANISFNLMDIEIRRQALQEILNKGE